MAQIEYALSQVERAVGGGTRGTFNPPNASRQVILKSKQLTKLQLLDGASLIGLFSLKPRRYQLKIYLSI